LHHQQVKTPVHAEASLAANSVPAEGIDVDVNSADREKNHDASEIDVKQRGRYLEIIQWISGGVDRKPAGCFLQTG
jgi:hypothetical protein